MEFLKKLIESAAQPAPEVISEEWHSVEGISTQIGDYRITVDGYFDETELYVNILNTQTGEEYRGEVFKNGNDFDINVGARKGRQMAPLEDKELAEFLTQLTRGFIQQNYDRILSPPQEDFDSDEYDSYHNRRERMRQGREYRSELDADYD